MGVFYSMLTSCLMGIKNNLMGDLKTDTNSRLPLCVQTSESWVIKEYKDWKKQDMFSDLI